MYLVLAAATAGAIAPATGIRVRNLIGRNGTRTELVDQVIVLSLLRSRQPQSLILVPQGLSLIRRKVINDAISHAVNGLQGVAIHLLGLEARLHGGLLNVTAAILNLVLDGSGVHHTLVVFAWIIACVAFAF